MTHVVDVRDPLNGGSLERFPVTLSDDEIREWWAERCRAPVTGLPTAREVAREYASRYRWSGWVSVIHEDGDGCMIDSSFVVRQVRPGSRRIGPG